MILKLIHLQQYLNDYQLHFNVLHNNIDPSISDEMVNNERGAFITMAGDLMLHECTIPDEGSVVAKYNNKAIAKPGSCYDKEKDH